MSNRESDKEDIHVGYHLPRSPERTPMDTPLEQFAGATPIDIGKLLILLLLTCVGLILGFFADPYSI